MRGQDAGSAGRGLWRVLRASTITVIGWSVGLPIKRYTSWVALCVLPPPPAFASRVSSTWQGSAKVGGIHRTKHKRESMGRPGGMPQASGCQMNWLELGSVLRASALCVPLRCEAVSGPYVKTVCSVPRQYPMFGRVPAASVSGSAKATICER